MPNQFLSDEFGDIEDYFITDYQLIDQYIGDQLWTWGDNFYGQIGNNTSGTNRLTPVTTYSGGTTWKSVDCGYYHTAAIKTDGTLWTWGRNSNGQIGDNTSGTNRSTPVNISGGATNWKSVACGNYHTAAIKTDGTLWTWGDNGSGQLGDNTSGTSRLTPVTTYLGGTNWKSVSCGGNHTVAIKTDGTLWTWGSNYFGQIGDNTSGSGTNRSTPVNISGGATNWKSISGGSYHTAAIKTDGTLWTWGYNSSGQLGNNTSGTNRSTPVNISGGATTWKSVACGFYHTAAIKTDGTLWTWGYNFYGQIGNNTSGSGTDRLTPVNISGGATNWKSVSGGGFYTAAIKTDGTLWTWGYNYYGQLGDNSTTQKNTPVTTFLGGTNWKSVSGGGSHTAAVQSGFGVDLS